MSKRTFRTLVIIAILIFIGYLIANKAGLFDEKEQKESSQAGRSKPLVVIKVLSDTSITDKIRTSGTLLADEQVTLTAETNGKVENISFEEGERIEKGQVLVKIDDSELQAQLLRLTHQKELLEKKEERQQKLLKKDGISQEAYDEILTELNSTIAEISRIKAQIKHAKIIAPFAGTIGLRYISEGSYVNPDTKVADLVKNDLLKLEFSVPEDYAGTLKKGQEVSFTTSVTDSTYHVKVYAVASGIDPSTRTLSARAFVDNKDKSLIPGSFADVEIRFRQYDNAVLIPAIALIPELEGQKVYLLKNGKAEVMDVTTGLRTDKYVMISRGLEVGDTLITSGILNLRPGIEVKVKNRGKDKEK